MCDIIAASEFNDMCDINQFLNMRNSYLLNNMNVMSNLLGRFNT